MKIKHSKKKTSKFLPFIAKMNIYCSITNESKFLTRIQLFQIVVHCCRLYKNETHNVIIHFQFLLT